MNLTLQRDQYTSFGVFGTLLDESLNEVCRTLEHSYLAPDGNYETKIPDGVYECVRGEHELLHGDKFETFEIIGVTDHIGLLFHAGNYNKDSEGCILVGENLAPVGSGDMITNSKSTFVRFMVMQNGIDKFTLTVLQ